MTEAATLPTQETAAGLTPLFDAAREAGIGVVASGSLLQGRLAEAEDTGGSAAADAIRFNLAAPGLDVALVGMSRTAHVDENFAARIGNRD